MQPANQEEQVDITTVTPTELFPPTPAPRKRAMPTNAAPRDEEDQADEDLLARPKRRARTAPVNRWDPTAFANYEAHLRQQEEEAKERRRLEHQSRVRRQRNRLYVLTTVWMGQLARVTQIPITCLMDINDAYLAEMIKAQTDAKDSREGQCVNAEMVRLAKLSLQVSKPCCYICKGEVKGVTAKICPNERCSEQVHLRCISNWFMISKTCPLCRTPCDIGDVRNPMGFCREMTEEDSDRLISLARDCVAGDDDGIDLIDSMKQLAVEKGIEFAEL